MYFSDVDPFWAFWKEKNSNRLNQMCLSKYSDSDSQSFVPHKRLASKFKDSLLRSSNFRSFSFTSFKIFTTFTWFWSEGMYATWCYISTLVVTWCWIFVAAALKFGKAKDIRRGNGFHAIHIYSFQLQKTTYFAYNLLNQRTHNLADEWQKVI